jgi:phosphoribosylaminoimidazole-succinocarboxamide synthase
MEVASKGEVYITNTNSWFKQLAVKMVKDHQEDAIA